MFTQTIDTTIQGKVVKKYEDEMQRYVLSVQ